ncbi:hypothetical protein LARI1_G004603 [Lachnellula arida]|uniref:Aminoglycoside phosphotransferase domain-containing protein n=1 Tax=Lachnellula arida TaxID=1316785 RepID=A0A8T9BGW7_9HELO|nr:hypothetical protein LARI1_G004603 [Lachnellula arida]
MSPDPISATDEELIAFCNANRKGEARIIQLSEGAVIKLGLDVTAQRPHLPIGYLVMEFIHGTELSSYLESADAHQQEGVVNGLLQALDDLASVPLPNGQGPGPVGGGPLRGYLWSDSGVNSSFNSVSELGDFLNTIADYNPGPKSDRFDFAAAKLVMCHGDLAPRNILQLDDGRLALLDWANAGFYPAVFEIYAFRTRVDREPIFKSLLSRLPQEEKVERQIERLASVEGVLLRQGDAVN